MHVYTSITTNYLPKARVLASSLKREHPDAVFHLVLSDRPPAGFQLANEPFDTLITLADLPIPDRDGWVFKHAVVELCTAVKGIAAVEIARKHQPKYLYYLDPDIAVLGKLDGLNAALDQHSVILTPHLTEPETDLRAIEDNEICAMRHGIYNLGFVGVNPADEGMRFLEWWSHRLLHFCYDDIPLGLFTDQRWADHVPAYFPKSGVMRDPQYNVATWNLSKRRATGTAPNGILVNGRPLGFFHFSGFDSGAQEAMLKLYGGASPVLFALRDWYVAECERMGQLVLGSTPCMFNTYDDGTPIPRAHRLLYRNRGDLRTAFPNPFSTASPGSSYLHWYRANVDVPTAIPEPAPVPQLSVAEARVAELEANLANIQSSRAWKLTQTLRKVWRAGNVAERSA